MVLKEHPACASAREAVAKGRAEHAQKLAEVPAHVHELRAMIDGTDAQLMGIIRRRLSLVRAVAFAKGVSGLPAHDPAREADLIQRFAPEAGPDQDIYREVIRACREHARPVVEAGLVKEDQETPPSQSPDQGSGGK